MRTKNKDPRPNAEFSPEHRDAIVDRYIALSREDDVARGIKLADVTMLVWPESAVPFILQRDPYELGRIGAMLPQTTSLVTGAARGIGGGIGFAGGTIVAAADNGGKSTSESFSDESRLYRFAVRSTLRLPG